MMLIISPHPFSFCTIVLFLLEGIFLLQSKSECADTGTCFNYSIRALEGDTLLLRLYIYRGLVLGCMFLLCSTLVTNRTMLHCAFSLETAECIHLQNLMSCLQVFA